MDNVAQQFSTSMRQFKADQHKKYMSKSKQKNNKKHSICIYVYSCLSIDKLCTHTKKENKLFSRFLLLLSSELNYFHSHQSKAQKSMLRKKLRVNPQTAHWKK